MTPSSMRDWVSTTINNVSFLLGRTHTTDLEILSLLLYRPRRTIYHLYHHPSHWPNQLRILPTLRHRYHNHSSILPLQLRLKLSHSLIILLRPPLPAVKSRILYLYRMPRIRLHPVMSAMPLVLGSVRRRRQQRIANARRP